MSTPEPRFSYRTSIHGGNSRICAQSIRTRRFAKALCAEGPSQPQPARPPRPGGRCPAPALGALTQGPGAALFDGSVLAPGRLLLQLLQDLFHLDFGRGPAADSERSARSRAGDDDAAAAAAAWPCASRRPRRSPASGPGAATDESRPLHAAGHVSPGAPPRPPGAPPTRVRCAPGAAAGGAPGAGAGAPQLTADAGPRRPGGGCPELARWPGVDRARLEGEAGGRRAAGGEGLTAGPLRVGAGSSRPGARRCGAAFRPLVLFSVRSLFSEHHL